MINSLPPDLLRSFVAVTQTKSFSRAAERVHLSQSTVSQQIRRLEDIVGKSLFERDTRTVTLTRDGTALQNYAARILDLMSEAVEHSDGDVVESIGTHVDVTEQYAAKEALQKAFDEIKKSEDRLRLVIDTIPTLVWRSGP